MREHRQVIADPAGRRDLLGGTTRLRVVAGRDVADHAHARPRTRARCRLPDALQAGAVVLLRTWVDDLPEEAKAITSLFLADAAASALALPEGTEWAALIDEFGGVLSSGAGERALALMQRARSAGGQVALSMQSVLDFAAATGNPALLDALADNFSAGVFHRQSSPESRDWLARLIGTREVWQLTDRTSGGGSRTEGSGSRRRVREFLVRPDDFRTLDTGEAVIWTTLGPAPQRITVTPAALPAPLPDPVDACALYRPCGPEPPAGRRSGRHGHHTGRRRVLDRARPMRRDGPIDDRPAPDSAISLLAGASQGVKGQMGRGINHLRLVEAPAFARGRRVSQPGVPARRATRAIAACVRRAMPSTRLPRCSTSGSSLARWPAWNSAPLASGAPRSPRCTPSSRAWTRRSRRRHRPGAGAAERWMPGEWELNRLDAFLAELRAAAGTPGDAS